MEADPAMPLLWVLRDKLGFKGTKFGCGQGICGACSLHVGGELVRSCSYTLEDVGEQEVTTIENFPGADHPVQKAWAEHQVPQCGYCQSGQIMAAMSFLKENKKPSESDINDFMQNLCRCGTYQRIKEALLSLANS